MATRPVSALAEKSNRDKGNRLEDGPHDDSGPGTGDGDVRFTGDLVGTGVVDMIAVSLPVEGGEYEGAAYVAVERITGSVHGRSGSFVATHRTRGRSLAVVIVPDSGTGELSGIAGEIEVVRHADGSHYYTLSYRLG